MVESRCSYAAVGLPYCETLPRLSRCINLPLFRFNPLPYQRVQAMNCSIFFISRIWNRTLQFTTTIIPHLSEFWCILAANLQGKLENPSRFPRPAALLAKAFPAIKNWR